MGSKINGRRRGRAGLVAAFLAGLVLGGSLSVAAQNQPQRSLDDFIFGRAESALAALHNVVISLAVDTERAAVGIADINVRLRKMERRIKALEGPAGRGK